MFFFRKTWYFLLNMGEEKTHIYSKFSIYASKVGFAKVLNVGFWELLNIGSLPGILEICRVEKNKNSISWNLFQQILDQTSNLNLGDVFFFASPSLKIVYFEHLFSELWTRSQTNQVWWGISSSLFLFENAIKCLFYFFSKNPACNKLEHWNVNIPCSTCKNTMQGTYASNFSSNYLYNSCLFFTWKTT